jgi:hypothetical protein
MIEADALLAERLAYTVKHSLPLSQFLAWPEHDQDLTLAYLRLQQRKCSRCGIDPQRVSGSNPELIPVFEVCQGCKDMESREKQIPERDRNAARIFWVRAEDYQLPDDGEVG